MKTTRSATFGLLLVTFSVTAAGALMEGGGARVRPTASAGAADGGVLSTTPRVEAAPQASRGSNVCELTVRIDKSAPSAGGAVILRAGLRNKSQGVIYMVENALSRDFEIEVRDGAGRIVPRAAPPGRVNGKEVIYVKEGGNRIVPIEPGAEKTYALHVGALYKLRRGSYTVSLKRVVFLADGKTTVEASSAPLKFTVKSARR